MTDRERELYDRLRLPAMLSVRDGRELREWIDRLIEWEERVRNAHQQWEDMKSLLSDALGEIMDEWDAMEERHPGATLAEINQLKNGCGAEPNKGKRAESPLFEGVGA